LVYTAVMILAMQDKSIIWS